MEACEVFCGLYTIVFSPNSEFLATSTFNPSAAQLWDVATHQEIAVLPQPDAPYQAIAFTHDGSILATRGNDHIYLWDGTTGEALVQIESTMFPVGRLAFTHNDDVLIAAEFYPTPPNPGEGIGYLAFWDVASVLEAEATPAVPLYRVLTGTATTLALNSDGTLIAIAVDDPDSNDDITTVSVWAVRTDP